MTPPFRYRLSDREKDALLAEQAALIERLTARIAELEALLAEPKKTSRNSHTPPSQDHKPGGGTRRNEAKRRKPRPSRPGVARRLADPPDETIRRFAVMCAHCAADVSGGKQRRRRCYEHIDIAPIRPHVTRIELYGGRCAACGKRYCALPPEGMAPGSPFGASIRSLLLYLHHSHHVGFARLSRMMAELFGLKISEGAIANAFRRVATGMTAACAAIQDKLRGARVIASDETTTRINGVTHWHWVFVSAAAVLHQIAPRRAKAVAEEVLGDRRPQVWASDRYAGQQDLAPAHQICLAHTIRTQLRAGIGLAWRWTAQRDDMADLQAIGVDDDALDDELQEGLFVGQRGLPQACLDARAKGHKALQSLFGPGALLAQPTLLILLAFEGVALLGDLLTALGQLRQADDPGLVGVQQARIGAPEPLQARSD